MWDILVVSVIYIPQKSGTFICLNATLSEVLLKFACNRLSFEDFLVFHTETQEVELEKLKTCSYFHFAVCPGYSLSPFFASFANGHIVHC